jgi:hypothetical protein
MSDEFDSEGFASDDDESGEYESGEYGPGGAAGAASDSEQPAAYDRLQRVGEGLEEREFTRGARLPFMRTRELVQSQEAVDDAGDRVWDAVRDARRLGMDWSVIADALKLPEQDVIDRYRQVDGI